MGHLPALPESYQYIMIRRICLRTSQYTDEPEFWFALRLSISQKPQAPEVYPRQVKNHNLRLRLPPLKGEGCVGGARPPLELPRHTPKTEFTIKYI